MYVPPAEPDPEVLDYALTVIARHNAGESYHAIADYLSISPGKAHHLAEDLLKARQNAAQGLVRPISRRYKTHKPDPFEVLGELRADMRRTEPLLLRYPDPEGAIDQAINDGDRFFDACAGRIRSALKGKESGEVADELSSIAGAYFDLLRLAHSLDETLQTEVDAKVVLETFHIDVLLLAEVTGSDLSTQRGAWTKRERALRPVAAPNRKPAQRRLGKEELRIRDEEIVRARLVGTPVSSVAEAHGITTRQVSRIVKNHRRASSGASPAALAAIERAVAAVDGEVNEIEEKIEQGVTPAKKAELAERMAGLDDRRIDIYRHSGLLSPDTYAAASAAAERARLDLVPKVNGIIRKQLTEHGVEREVIDSITGQVIEAGGIRLPDEDAKSG